LPVQLGFRLRSLITTSLSWFSLKPQRSRKAHHRCQKGCPKPETMFRSLHDASPESGWIAIVECA